VSTIHDPLKRRAVTVNAGEFCPHAVFIDLDLIFTSVIFLNNINVLALIRKKGFHVTKINIE
jgi:hypothetical protein